MALAAVLRTVWRWTISLFLVGAVAACGGGDKDAVVAAATAPPTSQSEPPEVMVIGQVRLAASAGAIVFWDTNNNWRADPWELSVEASSNGTYVIAKQPQADAALRARTQWSVPGATGDYDGPIPLSAMDGQPQVISPITTLAQISGVPIRNLEAVLGLPDGLATDADPLAYSDVVLDTARLVALQLQQRDAQLTHGAQADAGQGILYHSIALLSGADLATTDGNLVNKVLGKSNRAYALAAAPAAVANKSSMASQLPTFAVGTADSLLTGYGWTDFAWLIDQSQTAKRTAVTIVLNNLRAQKAAVTRDTASAVLASLNNYSRPFLFEQIRQLSGAGIVRNAEEIDIDAATTAARTRLNAQQTLEEKALNRRFLADAVSSTFSSPDVYLNMLAGVDAAITVGTGYGFKSIVGDPGQWRERKKKIKFLLGLTKAVVECAALPGAGAVDLALRIENATSFDEQLIVDTANWLNDLIGCYINAGGTSSKLVKRFYSFAGESAKMSKVLLDAGIAKFDGNGGALGVAHMRLMAQSLELAAELPLRNMSGVLSYVAVLLNTLADSTEIALEAGYNTDRALDQLQERFKRALSQVENEAGARKLRQRLAQVIAPLPSSNRFGTQAQCKAGTVSRFFVDCTLNSLRAQALALRAAASSEPSVVVSYGDGWTTATDPSTAGRTIRAGDTVSHNYLTPGTYTIVATTQFADGSTYRDQSSIEIVNDTQLDESLRPVLKNVTVEAAVGGSVTVTFDASAGGVNRVRDVRVSVRPILANGIAGDTCTTTVTAPGVLTAGGRFVATGCTGANPANAARLLVTVLANGSNGLAAIPWRATIIPTGAIAPAPVTPTPPAAALLISDLRVDTPIAGQPLVGRFLVSGMSPAILRVRAGASSDLPSCFVDLPLRQGFQTFTFAGNWVNESGRVCSELLPTTNTATIIVFKVEARDSLGNVANYGLPPTASAVYARPRSFFVESIATDGVFYVGSAKTIGVKGDQLSPATLTVTMTAGACVLDGTFAHTATQVNYVCTATSAGNEKIQVFKRDGPFLLDRDVTVNPSQVVPVNVVARSIPGQVALGQVFTLSLTTDRQALRAVVEWSDGTAQTSCGSLVGTSCAMGTSFTQTKLAQQVGALTYRATFYDVNNRVVATAAGGTTVGLPPTGGTVTTCTGVNKLGSRCLVIVDTTTDVQSVTVVSSSGSAAGVPSSLSLVSTGTFNKRFELRPGVLIDNVPRSRFVMRLTNDRGQTVDLPFGLDADASYPYTVNGMPTGEVTSGTRLPVTTTFAVQYNVQMRLVIDNDLSRAINFDQGSVATLDTSTLSPGVHTWTIEGYREGILVATRKTGSFSVLAATPTISSITVSPGKVLAGDSNGALLTVQLTSPASALTVVMQRPDCSTFVSLDMSGYANASQTSYSRRVASTSTGIYRMVAKAYRADGTVIAVAPSLPVLQFVATAAELVTPQTPVDFSACSVTSVPSPSLAVDFSAASIAALNSNAVSGGVSFISGKDGRPAAKFGGVASPGHIRISNRAAIQFTDAATFDVWVRMDSLSGMDGNGSTQTNGAYAMAVIAKSHDRIGGAMMVNSLTRSGGGMWLQSYDAGFGGSSCAHVPHTLVPLGTWARLTYVLSSTGGVRGYLNGQLTWNCPGARPDFTVMNGNDIYIGKFSDFWYPFNGAIQDLKIYKQALTAAEIASLP